MSDDERTITIEALRLYHNRLSIIDPRRQLTAELIIKQMAKLTRQDMDGQTSGDPERAC